MNDILKRLSAASTPLEQFAVGVLPTRALYGEARDEIERLSTLYSNAIARAEKAEEALRVAVLAECERCAKLCEEIAMQSGGSLNEKRYSIYTAGSADMLASNVHPGMGYAALIRESSTSPAPSQEEDCDYCADHVPAHGYWRCPECDAEWPDGDDSLPPPPVRETP